jgi:GNAT superfamily N-acetyltransferase
MSDMIVKLYDLPGLDIPADGMKRIGVEIRRPNPWERALLVDWVRRNFTETWVPECETAFAANPPSCYVAVEADALIGFACYDCTRRNFFGPTGVAEAARGRGVGLSLLLACLHAMRGDGYAYAIIGGVGPAEYYAKTVGATLIEGSSPGIYDFGLLRKAQGPGSRT